MRMHANAVWFRLRFSGCRVQIITLDRGVFARTCLKAGEETSLCFREFLGLISDGETNLIIDSLLFAPLFRTFSAFLLSGY